MAAVILQLLRDCDECVLRTVAEIYVQEWGWHFSQEWDIDSVDAMIEDLRVNYMDCTWVAFDDGEFVGTVALLDADLKSHQHLCPWVTCLYVVPQRRRQGLGKRLMDAAIASVPIAYLWCYTEHERRLYERWGFRVIESFLFSAISSQTAYVMMMRKQSLLLQAHAGGQQPAAVQ